MDINGEIKTKLTYKEVAILAVAVGHYTDVIKSDEELVKEFNRLINRLGAEIYSYPESDFTK